MYEFTIGNVVKAMERLEFETKVKFEIDQAITDGVLYEDLNVNSVAEGVLGIVMPEGEMIQIPKEATGYIAQQIMVKGHTMKHIISEKMIQK